MSPAFLEVSFAESMAVYLEISRSPCPAPPAAAPCALVGWSPPPSSSDAALPGRPGNVTKTERRATGFHLAMETSISLGLLAHLLRRWLGWVWGV